MQAVLGLQILILQLVFTALSFQLTSRVTIPCLWFLHPMSLFKYFKMVDISASLPDLKGKRIVIEIIIVACITCTLDDMQCSAVFL